MTVNQKILEKLKLNSKNLLWKFYCAARMGTDCVNLPKLCFRQDRCVVKDSVDLILRSRSGSGSAASALCFVESPRVTDPQRILWVLVSGIGTMLAMALEGRNRNTEMGFIRSGI